MAPPPNAEAIQNILRTARLTPDRPTDANLGTCYSLFIPSSTSSSGSSSNHPDTHWYCARAPSQIHRDAAEYLIFLFAYRRHRTAQIWLEHLENVLRSCVDCSRGFGIARREFGQLYMSQFPANSRTTFFRSVNDWQATFILSEATAAGLDVSPRPPAPTLGSLSTPIAQLLLAEPDLLEREDISTLITSTVSEGPTTIRSNITSVGLTPMLVRLLRSTSLDRRKWAFIHMQVGARNRVSFETLVRTGIGEEFEELLLDKSMDERERWKIVRTILSKDCFDTEAVEKGLLGCQSGDGKVRKEKGIMTILAPLLGTESNYFPLLLQVFSLLLQIVPSRSFWTFDPSPELPHSLFSDIKSNPSFALLLQTQYQPTTAASFSSEFNLVDKGKTKATEGFDPLGWIADFLRSLVPVQKSLDVKPSDTGFSEALARIMGDCFQDLQHHRYGNRLRAAAAEAGFRALSTLQAGPHRLSGTAELSLASTLSIHSKFIAGVAFRAHDHPLPTWRTAREAAQALLDVSFRADAKDIVESVLGLSLIVYEERRRQVKAKRADAKGLPIPPPVKVEKLHVVSVKKDLWSSAYNALTPTDPSGLAVFLKAVVTAAHIEKLNREETWAYSDLRLQSVLKEEDYVTAVRGINNGIVATRDHFAHAVESLAMQPDRALSEELWKQAGIARNVVVLLLSPAEDVHDPTVSLIQQSFDNVDDRADCFRVLLTRFPAQAMEGLCDFLVSFIDTARITPESCSLAKWLVRCFTDVLEALCSASDNGSEPILRSTEFTSVYANDEPMPKKILQLWHLMTTALAVILRRTIDWAPLYDNETMVDWMRDALIFGRQMADNIRVFEAATLSIPRRSSFGDGVSELPSKTTATGAKLVQKLENVLRDLMSWLRLTDVETLHQTFELIKTIVGRIAKTNPDVSTRPELELALLELDKFSRKASRSHRTRLSDDLLSELSDLLEPFNLETGEDEIQYIKSTAPVSGPAPSSATASFHVQSASTKTAPPKPKNAFEEMMRRAGGTTTAEKSQPASGSVPRKAAPIEVAEVDDVDEFDDDFLDNISVAELDNLEKKSRRAAPESSTVRPQTSNATLSGRKPASGQPQLRFPGKPVAPPKPEKLSIDLVRRPPAKASGFQSDFMKGMRREFKADRAAQYRRDGIVGGVVPKLPPASGLGTGLGVYQGPRRTIQPVDSGSSASDSSDGENRSARFCTNKEPKKAPSVARPLTERRPIKVLGTDMSDVIRQREERRARQHAQKMRLKPDLNGLYRLVLSWNPDHTGQKPPHHPALANDLGDLTMVPTTFPDAERYRRTMLPLFLQELWMQCLKDEARGLPLSIEVSSRAYEDDFLDMELMVHDQLPEGWYVNESDIVLLKTPTRGFLAKVQGFKRKYKDTAMKVRIMNAVDDPKLLGIKSQLRLQKHVSLSTALREYGALQGLPYYEAPLLRDILSARSARMPALSSREVRDAMENFTVNEPQAKAILGAMSVDGFALIQGPPGTGKTKTISGLVGKFLSDRGSYITSVGGDKPTKQKLLVCAPSNAAIDEVCKRLMHGVPSAYGGQHMPNIVRIGIETSVNIAVKPVALESLVEARVTSAGGGKDGNGEYTRIQAELEEVKKQITIKQEELRAAQGNDERVKQLDNAILALTQKRTFLGQQSSKAKDAARDATRHLEGARRSAKEAIMNEADIICATLSGAGHDSLAPYMFETVIIDEAAQAIEMSCLIPLKYGCKRCIMVGDPNQLPPTTFSPDAERLHYNEGLFVRMVKQNASNVQLLSIQYRMHPYISELPSKVFYNGHLKDGDGMAEKTKQIWHEKAIYGPYRFFNVEGVESKPGTSTKNTREAQVAVELVQHLQADFGDRINFDTRIGVITMYKEQLGELKRHFIQAFGRDIMDRIEFNTVDGFQGQEKDIIILSCVRSGPNLQTIGFLRDARRMNVALTRAKSSLFVIGNGPTLERSDERWKTIVGDARDRGFYANYHPGLFNQRVEREPESASKKSKKDFKPSKPKLEPSPSKSAVPKVGIVQPPPSVMDEAKPLKRKASVEVKPEIVEKKKKSDEIGDSDAEERRRKEKKEKKKEKKRRHNEESSTRSSTPSSTVSEATGSEVPLPNPTAPTARLSTTTTNPAKIPNIATNQSVPVNDQPHVGPSRPPPPVAGFQQMSGPKHITKPSAGSSALFHQKKKKKPPAPTGPKPPGPPIKQIINSNLRG